MIRAMRIACNRLEWLVSRLEALPDASDRWEMLLALLGRQFDIGQDAHYQAVGAIIETPPERVALFTQLRGCRR